MIPDSSFKLQRRLPEEKHSELIKAAVKPTVSIWLAETWRSAARKAKATSSRPANSPVQYLRSTHCNWTGGVVEKNQYKRTKRVSFHS